MKYTIIFFFAIIGVQSANAQRGGSFVLTYPIAFPMGDLHDYIDQTSFRGISMEFNRRQRPNIDIGIEVGWNVFYAREAEKVYTDKTAAVSGVQYRYTNEVPLLAGFKFYKRTGPRVSPYVGVGVGTVYVERATDFGLYRITTETWQFCVRPELGVTFKLPGGMSALIGAKYYQAVATEALDAQSFLSINVGFIFSRGL